jgi:hypothetical protein
MCEVCVQLPLFMKIAAPGCADVACGSSLYIQKLLSMLHMHVGCCCSKLAATPVCTALHRDSNTPTRHTDRYASRGSLLVRGFQPSRLTKIKKHCQPSYDTRLCSHQKTGAAAALQTHPMGSRQLQLANRLDIL